MRYKITYHCHYGYTTYYTDREQGAAADRALRDGIIDEYSITILNN